ncbi:TraX family protein [Methylomonas sp. OY6]|uniref:TraX family protein n=1 Tax=Methylomonas defluvii TaxID=3045149 RepID=A0ABU4ULS3_9GAMM|nr:TraX family protein [Methylomonas sp. OY6]MDX8129614.1 TraX family protein [Methylomonas sp. OY6]
MNYPRVVVADGTIEAIKWFSLILMIIDHTNKYLYKGGIPVLFNIGRLAMPLFVLVLAYNLARPMAFERGVHIRIIKRLALCGSLATPAFLALGGLLAGWWPLNFMFALLVLTLTIYLIEHQTITGYLAAAVVFLLGGSVVEYWWPGLILGLSAWWYCKTPQLAPVIIATISILSLRLISGNYWALAVLPVALIACLVRLPVPRVQWAFYAFYPLHLTALWIISMTDTTFTNL